MLVFVVFLMLVLLMGALVELVVIVLPVFPSFTIYMCGCSEVPLCDDYSNKYALSIAVCVYTISELICLLYDMIVS